MKRIHLVIIGLLFSFNAISQQNRIDIVRHDAPELAQFGDYDIGVRTLALTDRNRPDVLTSMQGKETVTYDRSLIVEIWYPALLADDQQPGTEYTTITRNLGVMANLRGRAVRDAAPMTGNAPMPLVIISHGYPGNRYLMSHLGENLASKGYVVASIDHRDSTYDNQLAFTSTLYNRPLDQLFVLDQVEEMSASTTSFLSGLVDTERTGVVGYSMGGYGLVINLGGGYSEAFVASEVAPPNGLALHHAAVNPDFLNNRDPRIKAGFAVAPWGMARGVWRPNDLTGIEVPTFYLSGSVDFVAGYEDGVRAIYENAKRSDRYLLTYVNAGHNAGAPIPLPIEIQNNDDQSGASHYTDPVWDTVRMNNIMDHFATAFFDYNLKGKEESLAYLDLVPDAHDGVVDMEEEQETERHTYWKGFEAGTARGLLMEHLAPGE